MAKKKTAREIRKCSECPTTFDVPVGANKLTCSKKCKSARASRLLRERKGALDETRQCPVCLDTYPCASTSVSVTCGKRSCVDTWALVCRKKANGRRRAALKSEPPKPQKPGAYALEYDPFLLSMTTGCAGIRSWLCPEMMPFGYDAGAVCIGGRG